MDDALAKKVQRNFLGRNTFISRKKYFQENNMGTNVYLQKIMCIYISISENYHTFISLQFFSPIR